MIRPARFQDIPAIEGLIRRQHARSTYAGWVAIHDKALTQLLEGAVAAMMQNGPGASYVNVAVRDSKVVGVLIGSLIRAYNIGRQLVATDLYFINEGAAADTYALVDGYVAWARTNPKVVQASLTWTDALPGAERAAALFKRKGFRRSGEIWEMRLNLSAGEEAA